MLSFSFYFLKRYLDFHSINSASPKVSKAPDGLFFEEAKIFFAGRGMQFLSGCICETFRKLYLCSQNITACPEKSSCSFMKAFFNWLPT